jgi:D-sedoheptulose 7-phosphate isomerase
VKSSLQSIFDESVRVKQRFLEQNLDVLARAIRAVAETIETGNKVLFFGNGGSAADAQHLAAEFVNRYLIERPPLPAVALTTDSSVVTAIANDFSFDEVFAKQIRALGKRGDCAVGISTSGRSRNVIEGLTVAAELGLRTIGLGGPSDGPMRETCEFYLAVEGAPTPRIQETHVVIGHAMVEMMDHLLFGGRNLK